MAQSITGSTPVAPSGATFSITAALTENTSAKTETVRFTLGGLSTPSPFTVSSVLNSTNTITPASAGGFYGSSSTIPRVGDGVTGTGIPASTVVQSVDNAAAPTIITLSNAATASATSTLTFTPAAPTGDIVAIVATISATPSASGAADNVVVTAQIVTFDGTGNPVTPAVSTGNLVSTAVAAVNVTAFKKAQRN